MSALVERLRPLAVSSAPLRWWLTRGSTAVFDQALFAGGNFLLTVTLASVLPAAEFGAFTFAFVLFMILVGCHNALILEPATVLRTSFYDDRCGAYCRAQLLLHAAVTVPMAMALGCVGAVLAAANSSPALGRALLGAAAAAPFLLLLSLARRFVYILARPAVAARGSVVYLVTILVGLWVAWSRGRLSPVTGFLVLAGGSTVAAIFVLWGAGVLSSKGREVPLSLRDLGRERWAYGKWLLGAVCVEATVLPGLSAITAAVLGLGAVGILRAMQIFTVPLGHALTALSALALPVLARDFGRGHMQPLRNKVNIALAAGVGAAIAIELVLIVFRDPLEHLVYRGKFAEYTFLIPIVGAAALLEGLAALHAMLLSAVQRPHLYLTSLLITAPCAVVTGVICTRTWGLTGAAAALVITAGLSVVTRRWLARPWLVTPQPRTVP